MSSSQSPSVLAPSSRSIPSDLACLIRYEPLEPNFDKQAIRHGKDGNNFWAPPNIKTGYDRDRTKARLFRWKGGRVTEISNDTSSLGRLTIYGAATVFTQYPDTHHLLVVEFDAETKDVCEHPGGWKVLSFNHRHQPGSQNTFRSSITEFGAHQQLAAPGSSQWVPQLIPRIYDYDPREVTNTPRSAGLIGERHRGIVVTVYLDPANSKTSSKAVLDHLQEGYY
ncbi:MAG: hypothetical protein L6R35_005444, partial [Caloplaca aegaea]